MPAPKEKQRTVTPKLRFPEFRKEKGWRQTSLEQIIDFQSGGTPSKTNSTFWNGTIPWVSAKDMKQFWLDDSEDHITTAAVDNGAKQVLAGTVLMLIRGMTLLNDVPICVARRPMSFNQDVKALRAKDDLDDRFLPYLLLANKDRLLSMVDVSGHGTGKLNTDELKMLDVTVPQPDEQKKIADCLTSLDVAIAGQARKVDTLKIHKKGLMQQIFPREGETIPRLRFPEFRDKSEWSAHPFEEFVVKSFYGTSSSTSPTGQYPVLRMGNMVDGGLDFSKMVYIDLDREYFESLRLMSGDILLNRTNSPDLVGKISIFQADSECITASYIVTFRLDKDRLNPTFCNSMLNTALYQGKIKVLSRPSVSQANINPTTFRKELIVSVPSPDEQNRVADCLSTLDVQIAAESEKFVALKTHKKGLMQQLFPAPEEG